MLIRILMEPLRIFLGKQFERAAETWTYKQRATLAGALQAGTGYRRRFRVVDVAEGQDDTAFLAKLRVMFEPSLWSVMPPSFHTVSNRALSFRCLSRMGCAFEKLLRSRHDACPFVTFLVLVDPSVADKITRMPPCLLDPWTKRLLDMYPTMQGDELIHIIAAVAEVLRVDISHLESRNASIRRLLTSRSVQTHPMTSADLSAQWVFQQHRTGSQVRQHMQHRTHTMTIISC